MLVSYILILYIIYLATRPLLRQIENLQSSHANQADNWERVEKSLTERLGKYPVMIAHFCKLKAERLCVA